jgi:hypothetical protein
MADGIANPALDSIKIATQAIDVNEQHRGLPCALTLPSKLRPDVTDSIF